MSSSSASAAADVRVCITGAAGQIGYSLIPLVASGQMFGPHVKVDLRLLDIQPCLGTLSGVVMELEDCSYPTLKRVLATADPREAFDGCDVALLVGAFPRKDGMERKDLLAKNAGIFEAQGRALDAYASRNCKILVVGNPANTNCWLAKHFAPSLPAKNFSALTRLDHNRAKGQLGLRVGVDSNDVHNVFIWGNHSATQYPDVNHGFVRMEGRKVPIREAVHDDAYLDGDFIKVIQQRGAAVIKARGMSSAMSAANAVLDHMRSWLHGTPEGEYVSMAIVSDGSYGVPEGLVFSFPVTCSGGEWHIVQGLDISQAESQRRLRLTTEELTTEKDQALEVVTHAASS